MKFPWNISFKSVRQTVAVPIFAWLLSATLPSTTSIEYSDIEQDVKTNVSSILSKKSDIPESITQAIIEWKETLKQSSNTINNPESLLFPTSVQTIWMDRFSKGLLGNFNYVFEEHNPILVDVKWENLVNCAATMRGFIRFATNDNDKTENEMNYINKQNVNAWMLAEEMKKIWYTQKVNFMSFFDKKMIWEKDVVSDKKNYTNQLLQTWLYLNNEWIPGSMLFIYFNLSNYKWVVKNYNEEQKQKNHNYTPHYNTHQAMFMWKSFKEFRADKVRNIKNGVLSDWSEMEVIDYITNFTQQRWWYQSALKDTTKQEIKNNLTNYYSLINIEINWKKVNLTEELTKTPEHRIKIIPSDIIRFVWPVMADGFHNVNTNNKSISQKNNLRLIFYWEFLLIWTYTPSELMVPNQQTVQDESINKQTKGLFKNLDITNFYSLRPFENLDIKLKEAILRYKFGQDDQVKETDKEIEMINMIVDNEWSNFRFTQEYNLLRKKKIDSVIVSLGKEEQNKFFVEYDLQIKWLQMMWYMQHPWQLNEGATNVNAPIPLFAKETVESKFQAYIELKKKEIKDNVSSKNVSTDKTFQLYFYPLDNPTKVFKQLQDTLSHYTDRYSSFLMLWELDETKQNKLLDIIDKFLDDKNIDISNWKIPSMRSVKLLLDFIDKVLKDIIDESYIEKLPLSYVDDAIIKEIAKTPQDYDTLSYIITQETYEQGFPLRKFAKKIWRMFGKTSSYWDFQLKLYNLHSKEKSLLVWPNVEQLEKALSYIDNPEIQKLIERRKLRFYDVVEPDLVLITKLKEILSNVNESNRLEKWKEVYDILKELFRFNDSREINIVWKVIQASLTLEKVHEHYANLNAWLDNSDISLEAVHYNPDLQKRYQKTSLVTYHRSEKIALVWIGENYILRCLEALWQDINSDSYPKLWKDFKWHIEYGSDSVNAHFDFYKWVLSFMNWDIDDETKLFKTELEKWLMHIQLSEYSANSIYKLFQNKTISSYLEKHNYDRYPIPTLQEFENTPFRRLFFDYAKTPFWRTPPKIYDFSKIWMYASSIGLLGIFALWGWLRNLKRIRKTSKSVKIKSSNKQDIATETTEFEKA